MRKLLFILPFLISTSYAQVVDSLTLPTDSLSAKVNHKLDSLEGSFNKQVDSLKQPYGQTKNKIGSLKNVYQHKIDSMNDLKLSSENYRDKIESLSNLRQTEKYTNKIDSLNNELAREQQKATAKIDSLKSKVMTEVKSLNLPPEAEERISKLTVSVDKINLPSIDADIENKIGLGSTNVAVSGLTTPGINTNGVPNVNVPTTDPSLPPITIPGNDVQSNLGGVVGKAEGVQQHIQEGVSAERVEQTITDKASQLDQVKAIQDQTVPEVVPGGVPTRGDEAKEQLKILAKKEAMNHFAGKEAALEQAMDKMSKYKKKYNSVASIKDIQSKKSNPLNRKPFIERLVPGITLQFQSFQYFMLDVNASAGYQFTKHITAGLGWNQRWAYSIDSREFNHAARMFGIRSYGEYHFKKGFALRAELECMNSFVKMPVASITETGHREWVWSALTGVKQEYRITKFLKGNAHVLYNLFDPHHKSPYVNRLNVRVGFEFVIKKKKKEIERKK